MGAAKYVAHAIVSGFAVILLAVGTVHGATAGSPLPTPDTTLTPVTVPSPTVPSPGLPPLPVPPSTHPPAPTLPPPTVPPAPVSIPTPPEVTAPSATPPGPVAPPADATLPVVTLSPVIAQPSSQPGATPGHPIPATAPPTAAPATPPTAAAAVGGGSSIGSPPISANAAANDRPAGPSHVLEIILRTREDTARFARERHPGEADGTRDRTERPHPAQSARCADSDALVPWLRAAICPNAASSPPAPQGGLLHGLFPILGSSPGTLTVAAVVALGAGLALRRVSRSTPVVTEHRRTPRPPNVVADGADVEHVS
jgi:hypothetical protein